MKKYSYPHFDFVYKGRKLSKSAMKKTIEEIIDIDECNTLSTVGANIVGGCLPKKCN